MPALPSYFTDFIKRIRLQDDLRMALQEAHQDLTERLAADPQLVTIIVATFLQGSYKRATILDPDADDAADVDIVVVTRLDERSHPEPATAMRLFEPFLQRNYPGQWEPQDRSFGIRVGRVKMDLVITSAPSEALTEIIKSRAVGSTLTLDDDAEYRIRKAWLDPAARRTKGNWRLLMEQEGASTRPWREEPLRIPDRRLRTWEPTHPLAQIEWTAEKNAKCNGLYLDVVRAVKWWRRLNPTPKYPKGYPIEHLVGSACPDGITSTADGVSKVFNALHTKWQGPEVGAQQPYLRDHGVDQNVLARVSTADFATFCSLLGPAAKIADDALRADDRDTGVQLWQKLFGIRFPEPPEWSQRVRNASAAGFSARTEKGLVGGGRFG